MRHVSKEDFKAYLIAQLEKGEGIHYSGGVEFSAFCLSDIISQVPGSDNLLNNAYFESCTFGDGVLSEARFTGGTIFKNCTVNKANNCKFGEVIYDGTRFLNPLNQRDISNVQFRNYSFPRERRKLGGEHALPNNFFENTIVNHDTFCLIVRGNLQRPIGISGTLPPNINQNLPLANNVMTALHGLAFENCRFEGVLLDRADLHLCDFINCNFEQSDFAGAIITITQLREVAMGGGKTAKTIIKQKEKSLDESVELGALPPLSLEDVSFQNCTFSKWKLSGADLRRATFNDDCKFEDADFSGAKLRYSSFQQISNNNSNRKASFNGLILEGETFPSQQVQCKNFALVFVTCDFRSSTFQPNENFSNCTFKHCNFDNTKLKGVFVSYDMFQKCLSSNNSDIGECLFSEQDLAGKDFSGLKLYEVSFQNCTFDSHTNFSQTRFIGRDERQNRESGSRFIGCDISSPNFDGAEFTRTNFNSCSFTSQQSHFGLFRDCNFHYCDLSHTRFDGVSMHGCLFASSCMLLETSFRNTVLHDVCFVSETGSARSLQAESLAGADLLGSSLPSYLENFQPILATGSEAIKNAKPLFIILVSLCFYTAIALRSTAIHEGEFTLPFFTSLKLQKTDFFLFTLVAISGVFVYFHMYLQRLWDSLRYLPAVFPDGAPVWDRVSPWMFSVLAWKHFKRLEDYISSTKPKLFKQKIENERIAANAPKNYGMQLIACTLLGWILPVGIGGWSFLEAQNATHAAFYTNNLSSFTQLLSLNIIKEIPLLSWFMAATICGITYFSILFWGNVKKTLTPCN